MASEQEVAYHRSFLAPDYLDNFRTLSSSEKLKKRAAEVDAIRLRDPGAFEEQRKFVAQLLKVPYRPGYMQVYRGDQGGRDHWVSGVPSDAQVAECMAPTIPPQGVVKSPTTGVIALPILGFTREAYVHGTVLNPVDMYEKMDQQFEDYATPWELVWSNLSAPYNRGFTPIVDRSWTVIGHFGTVQGGPVGLDYGQTSLILPAELAGEVRDLKTAFEAGVPVFVHSATGLPSGWVNANFYTSEQKVQVRTGVDGEVLDYQLFNTGYLVEPWYSPMDLYCAAKILVGLTKIGARVVTSLVRRAAAKAAARDVLKGATKVLARKAEEDAAKKGIARGLSEGDLVSVPRSRGASRVLRPAEMEALLKDTLSKRPYLARLRLARRLDGAELRNALMNVIKEFKESTGKLHLRVTEGTVKRLGSMGGGGWALDSISGKEVLIIEGELFDNPRKLLNELTHELAYDAVRDGLNGVPALGNESPYLNFAHDWLERVIKEGEPTWGLLRGMPTR
jgi:hypothetical protein